MSWPSWAIDGELDKNMRLLGIDPGLRNTGWGLIEVKNNHLKHLHEDVDKLHGKVDHLLYAILGGLGATILTLIGLFG